MYCEHFIITENLILKMYQYILHSYVFYTLPMKKVRSILNSFSLGLSLEPEEETDLDISKAIKC